MAGGVLAASFEGVGARLRARFSSPAFAAVDGALGAALTACVGLLIAWVLGAVALQAGPDIRRDVQRSAILRQLNAVLPPTGPLLNTLRALDPFPRIDGPEARVPAPRAAIARDPQVAAARDSVVKILGTACGVGVEGSGWVASPGVVVTNAHVVAGQDDTRVLARGNEPGLEAQAIAFDSAQRPRDPARRRARRAVAGAGARPEVGHLGGDPRLPAQRARTTCGPAGSATTREVVSQDAYGRGPVRREIVVAARRGALRQLRRPDGRRRRPRGDDDLRRDDERPARRLRRAERDRARRARGCGWRGRHGTVRWLSYPAAATLGKTLVIAEKPSVGRDLTRSLPGAFQKHEGYLESDSHVVTWAVGHLVQLAEPDEYDPKFKKWRMADLPIVPDEFRLVVRDERSKKQFNVISKQLRRDDVDVVINACDAGREGELIFAWTYEKAKAKKPVERLWLSSMTSAAIKDAFGALRPADEFDRLEQAARSRSEADWIVGMNSTRAATIRLRSSFDGAVSLGRVQTPTLAILARREEEIRAFVPEPYWLVDATFEPTEGESGRSLPRPLPRGLRAADEDRRGGRRRSSRRFRGSRARSPSSRRRPRRSGRRSCTTSRHSSARPTRATASPPAARWPPRSACTRSTRR